MSFSLYNAKQTNSINDGLATAYKNNSVLHPCVNPSSSPERAIIRDIKKPTQTGAQIMRKLYKASTTFVWSDTLR